MAKMERSMHRVRLLGSLFVIALAAAPAGLFGQRNDAVTQPSSGPTQAEVSSGSTPDQPALQQRNPRYTVALDDVLAIKFPLSPEFDQASVKVQPDGYINLEGGAKSIYVRGMTVPEVVQELTKAYSGTLHDPIINVDLVDFQGPFFLVSGQVGKPGQFDLRHDTTVSEAIAIAGGFLPTAKTQVFLYHRVSTNWVEVKQLKLNDILHGKNANEDAQLSSGDMIFVPEKFIANFRKYVPYSFGSGLYANTF
jgi:polysaccharide export outer membrane protein